MNLHRTCGILNHLMGCECDLKKMKITESQTKTAEEVAEIIWRGWPTMGPSKRQKEFLIPILTAFADERAKQLIDGYNDTLAIKRARAEALEEAAKIADGECADGIRGENPNNCLCQPHHIYRQIRALKGKC